MTDSKDKDHHSADEAKSRKDRPTGSMHVGDADFDPNDPAFDMDATWADVCRACCVHTPQEWFQIFLGICVALFFLYFFLVGLDFLGTGAKVMCGCAAGSLFGDDVNPIAGLMIGILVTVLLQSSSTSTSLIVSLVGADAISVKQGIYMVMGANIGTTVTNTLVALGHLGDGDQLERAFAGATVHDMFNFMTVAILLPLEAASGYLFYLTKACVKNFTEKEGDEWEGPIKKIVGPIQVKVLIANKAVPTEVAKGGSCSSFYPIVCSDPNNPTASSCEVGLIGCNKDTNECPAFFDPNASQHDDVMSGLVVFIIGLAMLFVCLFGLVHVLQKMLLGTSTRIIHKSTNVNGYVAMAIGCAITVMVQSSSITTSALTPLVGIGVLKLEQMFPLTLGANIGTCVTGLLAGLLSDVNGMQVALAHFFFNVTGIVIWYPLPFMRRVPLHAARQLGRGTRIWKGFPLVYIGTMFFLVPLIFLGISYLFTAGTKGLTIMGSLIVVALFFFCCWLAYHCQYKGGKERCYNAMVARQTRREALDSLPEDMQYLKAKIQHLIEFTGLPDDEESGAVNAPGVPPAGEDKDEEQNEEEDAA